MGFDWRPRGPGRTGEEPELCNQPGYRGPGNSVRLCRTLEQNYRLTDDLSNIAYQLQEAGLDPLVKGTGQVTGAILPSNLLVITSPILDEFEEAALIRQPGTISTAGVPPNN